MNNQNQNDDTVRVFVSHRHDDDGIAEGLKELLEPWGAGRLKLFLSEEIPGGDQWLVWIQGHLQTANLLLLLYTTEDARWDWCLYEAGLFEGKIGERKLVIFHPPDVTRPSPLTHLQMIEITPANIKSFILDFFGTSIYYEPLAPLNTVLTNNPKKVTELGEDVCALFNEQSRVVEKIRWKHLDLVLSLTRDEVNQIKLANDDSSVFEAQGIDILNRARIAKTSYLGSYEIFGFAEWDTDLTLQTLHDKWSKCKYASDFTNIDWLRDVCLQIIRVIRNETAVEIRTPFKSGADSRNWYLPVINRAQCSAGGIIWNFRLEFYSVPKDGW